MNPVTNYCESVLGNDKEAKESLRLIPEFADCSDTLLDMIFCYSKPVNLKPGEVLIKEGLFDQWVYFIIKGELDVIISGKSLGSTNGPIVGERCILGEPRGANLVASSTGLMALGVEMTIVDELNRTVNDYRKTASSEEELLLFSEEKMGVSLELLVIILLEVMARIINMYRTGENTLKVLKRSRPDLQVQLQSLYSFNEDELNDKSNTSISNEVNTQIHQTKNISVYSFNDFADIVYFELLQKYLYNYGYEAFTQVQWREHFIVDQKCNVAIWKTYNWLKKEFGLQNSDLIEITYSIFEVASKFTAAANNSISAILAISDCDNEKQSAIEEATVDERIISDETQNIIFKKLFLPIEETLKSMQTTPVNQESGKMSQADIDALFG